jgi:hypothetical protein
MEDLWREMWCPDLVVHSSKINTATSRVGTLVEREHKMLAFASKSRSLFPRRNPMHLPSLTLYEIGRHASPGNYSLVRDVDDF